MLERVRGSIFHRVPPERLAIAAVLAAFGIAAFVRAWMFYWFPGLPGLYAKDLGVNFIVAEYMRNTIHTPRDFIDMLGWSAWWDQPFFMYNAYTSYIAIVPIADLVNSTWASIKFLELAQTAIACAATYWLVRLFGWSRLWSLATGTLYAVVPAVILMPRGNLDLGWPTVLAPACLAAGVALIRRLGANALPLCGVICAICGYCSAVEYAFFLSFPAYAILASYAFVRTPRARWFALSLTGILVTVAFGAYFVVPTLNNHVFSDSSVRRESLVNASFVQWYSEDVPSYAGLILREALLSPVSLYNATGQLPIAVIAGTSLWLFAIIGFLHNKQSLKRPAAAVAASVVLIMGFLSVCALLPGGETIWRAFGLLPVINAIRTPDRFVTLPILAIVILSVDGVRRFSMEIRSQRMIAPIILAIVLLATSYVAVVQQVWTNQQDYGAEEPALEQVNRIVSDIGPRTAPYTELNGGSTGDYPSYGVPTAIISGLADLAARYGDDGVALTGVLPRASVKTVITTPPWAASDADGYPDFGALFDRAPATREIFRSHENVRVFALNANPMIKGTHIACLTGGPGLVDRLLAWNILANVDLAEPNGDCAFHIISGRDAYDAALRSAQWAASGSVLCRACPSVRDADYRFDPGRELLNQAWYRNSIDGESPLFAPAAVRIDDGTTILLPPAASGNGSRIALHLASHAYVTLSVRCGTSESTVRVLPFRGFRWLTVRTPEPLPKCRPAQLSFSIDDTRPANVLSFAGGLALDGAIVPGRSDQRKTIAASASDIYTFSTSHFTGDAATPYAARTVLLDRGAPSSPLHWNGASGTITIVGEIIRPQERLHKSVRFAEQRFLRHGEVITLPNGQGVRVSGEIQRITAMRGTGRVALFSADTGLVSGDVDFPAGASALSQTSGFSAFAKDSLSSNGLTGRNGNVLTIQIPAVRYSSAVVAGFLGVDGDGYAQAAMRCGTKQNALRVLQNVGEGLSVPANGASCTLRIAWHDRPLTIRRIFFNIPRESFDGERKLSLPRGSYRLYLLSRRDRYMSTAPISIDGRRIAGSARIEMRSSGAHTITFTRMPAESAFVAFVPWRFSPPQSTAISLKQTAAIRYDVSVPARTDLKLAHLDDGNWALAGSSGTVFGNRCDLVCTCYVSVAPGRYRIYHRLPQAVRAGFTITLLASIVAVLCLWLPGQRFLRGAA